MAVSQKTQVDIFGIVVLIISILIQVFLIIAAMYYNNMINLKFPSTTNTIYLFWTSIIMIIIFLALSIFSFYRIYTHKSIVFDAEKHIVISPPKKSNVIRVNRNQTPVAVKRLSQPVSVRPVSVRPVSVQPVSVQPVSVQPVSVQPVSVQPVSVQPVSVQPVYGINEMESQPVMTYNL
jgi:hypothetical protein